MGEIENTTNETYHDVLIIAEFTDSTGKKKWETDSGVKIGTLAPHSKSKFSIFTDKFARYEIKSVTYTK